MAKYRSRAMKRYLIRLAVSMTAYILTLAFALLDFFESGFVEPSGTSAVRVVSSPDPPVSRSP